MHPDEFISLTSIDDGHAIHVRYSLIRSMEEKLTDSGLPYSKVSLCGAMVEPYLVMESLDKIFDLIAELSQEPEPRLAAIERRYEH